jgi:hypothetical protein
MLELKPNCECCDKDLPPDVADAMICTYEYTFYASCVDTKLNGICPNCVGNFSARPIRPIEMLNKHPPSSRRTGCSRACVEN